jgi:hypothetical protein
METKPVRRTARRLSAGLFALSGLTLPAGELSAYHSGDVADADITPPASLDGRSSLFGILRLTRHPQFCPSFPETC